MKQKNDVFTSKEDKWDFIIALIVIFLFSLFIYQFLFKTEEEEVSIIPTGFDETQTLSPAANTENIEDQYLYTNSDKYQTKKIKAEDAYESEIDSAVVIWDDIKTKPTAIDIIPKSIGIDNVSNLKNTDNKTITPSNSQIETDLQVKVTDSIQIPSTSTISQIKVEDTINTTLNKTKQLEEEEEQIEDIEETTTAVQPEIETNAEQEVNNTTLNCVIIVGAFKELNNKTAIIDKLISLGFTYTEGTLRQGLDYVGVPVDCDNKQQKKELLSTLNQAFGIQSWVKKI